LGELAEVPIEPPEQTRLADATMNIVGCLISGVPGAGAFDAIFAIVLSPLALRRVETLWEEYEHPVLPLVLREDSKGVTIDDVPEKIANII